MSFAQCPIYGTPVVCVGAQIELTSDTTSMVCSGGLWSSSNPAVATVDTSVGFGVGVVVGLTAGTTTISYAMGGSVSTVVVTVNPGPPAIMGLSTICSGYSTTFTYAALGGL